MVWELVDGVLEILVGDGIHGSVDGEVDLAVGAVDSVDGEVLVAGDSEVGIVGLGIHGLVVLEDGAASADGIHGSVDSVDGEVLVAGVVSVDGDGTPILLVTGIHMDQYLTEVASVSQIMW